MVKVQILRIPGKPGSTLTLPPSRRGRKPRSVDVGDTVVITTAQAESLEAQGVKIEIVEETASKKAKQKREDQRRAEAAAGPAPESLDEAKARTRRSRASQEVVDDDAPALAIETGDN